MALDAGARLGPYQIVAALGAGGMGEVYKAVDPRLNRTVAIKVSEEEFSDRLKQEAHAVAALNHPNICQIYDFNADYLVMEFVDGVPICDCGGSRGGADRARFTPMEVSLKSPRDAVWSPDGKAFAFGAGAGNKGASTCDTSTARRRSRSHNLADGAS